MRFAVPHLSSELKLCEPTLATRTKAWCPAGAQVDHPDFTRPSENASQLFARSLTLLLSASVRIPRPLSQCAVCGSQLGSSPRTT